MFSFKSPGDLQGQLQGFFDWDEASFYPIRQCLPLNQLENKEVGSYRFFETMNCSYIGVIE